jgi:hypothetical protein
MKLEKIMESLALDALTPQLSMDADVARAHASDLLSDVLANAPAGGILLTIQVHMNVIAVALHAGLAAVVFTSGMRPDDAVAAKAIEEKLPLFGTGESTFDAAGRLYTLGLRGGVAERDHDGRAHG